MSERKYSKLTSLLVDTGLGGGFLDPDDYEAPAREVPVSALAAGLGLSEAQAIVLASAHALPIRTDRKGDRVVVDVGVLTALLRYVGDLKQQSPSKRLVRAQEAHQQRESLIQSMCAAGLEFLGSDYDRGALLRFRRQDGSAVAVMSYISKTINASGQVTFSLSRIDDPSIDWYALVACRLNRTYLRPRAELAAMSADGRTVGITVRPNSKPDQLLERRLEQVVSGWTWGAPQILQGRGLIIRKKSRAKPRKEKAAQQDQHRHTDAGALWSLALENDEGAAPPVADPVGGDRQPAPRKRGRGHRT